MAGSIVEVFPEAAYQRCAMRFYHNVLARVPKSRRAAVAAMFKAIHVTGSRGAAEAKALAVAEGLDGIAARGGGQAVSEGFSETLTYTAFPCERWHRIRTNNAIERLNHEIRRRTRVVGAFPDGKSALMPEHPDAQVRRGERMGFRRDLGVTLLEG